MREPFSLPPRLRAVDPRNEPSLEGFSCGGATEYEREVEEIVEAFRTTHRPLFLQFTIAEDVETDMLAGLCALHWRDLPRVSPAAMYVGIISVEASFRGRRLPGDMRLGDYMLSDALARLDSAWIVVPPVWAVVDRVNEPSRNMFERQGFAELPDAGGKNVIVFRPARSTT